MFSNIAVLSRHHIIGRIPVAETIHIDLIHHGSLGPIRRKEARNNSKGIDRLQILRNTAFIKKYFFFSGTYFEKVKNPVLSYRQLQPVIIKQRIGCKFFHRKAVSLANQVDTVHIILCCAENHGHIISRIDLHWNTILTCFIRKECVFIYLTHLLFTESIHFPTFP